MISSALRFEEMGPMATICRTGDFLLRLAACFAFVMTAFGPAFNAGAQTPSPALLVPATLKIVGRVPSGGAPHEIVASDDAKFAYISNYASDRGMLKTISIVDLTKQKALTPVDLGALCAPHGLAFADGKAYFTA